MSYHIKQAHVVHKHKLELYNSEGRVNPLIELALPGDAKITLFGQQGAEFYIWEYHNTTFKRDPYTRTFWLAGTGHEIPGELLITDHIGSFQASGFVWHLFEVADQTENMEPTDAAK